MKQEQIVKAEQWQRKHKDHVEQLMRECHSGFGSYEPTEEDAGSPELWKPGGRAR